MKGKRAKKSKNLGIKWIKANFCLRPFFDLLPNGQPGNLRAAHKSKRYKLLTSFLIIRNNIGHP